MKNIKRNALKIAVAIFTMLPALSMAQEVTVKGGEVKIKGGGAEVSTGSSTTIKTNTKTVRKASKGSAVQTINTITTKEKRISGSNLMQTITCNGETLIIVGNGNAITVKGFVRSIKLTGNNNAIKLDKVQDIKVDGDNNSVMYIRSSNSNGVATASTTGSGSFIGKIE